MWKTVSDLVGAFSTTHFASLMPTFLRSIAAATVLLTDLQGRRECLSFLEFFRTIFFTKVIKPDRSACCELSTSTCLVREL